MMNKLFAAITILVVIVGTVAAFFGLGESIPPIKDSMKLGLDLKGGVYVVMEAETDATGQELKTLMAQAQAVIEKRVNQMGLSEPVVTIEGEKRIRVELPGAEDAKAAIDTIGRTAQLEFVTADGKVILDGSKVKNAGVAIDTQNVGYVVTLEFNGEGSQAFQAATEAIVANQIKSATPNMPDNAIMIVLDGEVISSPVVSSVISGGKAQIEGNFTDEEASQLSILIRGGALPVGLKEVQTSLIGPTIGLDALSGSLLAGAIGIAVVVLIMLLGYNIMGIAAVVALVLYILIDIWVLQLLGSVLTLPGIAGFILSVGMAVDSNVIIFSRIREEIKNGKTVRVSIDAGFRRAFATVVDSQLTTMLAGIVLYQLGSGPVRGFALTLMIGILASIFTAVFVTQSFLKVIGDSRTFSRKKYFGIKEVN